MRQISGVIFLADICSVMDYWTCCYCYHYVTLVLDGASVSFSLVLQLSGFHSLEMLRP